MKDVVLIGRPGAGKTCMAKIMSGGVAPTTHISTVNPTKYEADNGWSFLNLFQTIITDIGGNDQNETTWKDHLLNYSSEDGYDLVDNSLTFYVFDGNAFLEELNNHWAGGPIGSEIRNTLKSVYGNWRSTEYEKNEKNGKNAKIDELPSNLYFIATHRDQCLIGNMKKKILDKMSDIQKEYPGRYFFYQKMMSTLHCINAKDVEEVKDLFKHIVGE